MIIKYYRKQVYGTELIYPADEKQATAIQYITGQKTLTKAVRHGLAGLGHSFEEVLPERQAI